MDRYTLTQEGRARFRRMETRANVDTSVATEDYEVLHFLYTHGAATIEELERHTGLNWNEMVNEISTLMSRGLIEGLVEQRPSF
jgi:predicted transcriptional regulator